MYTITKGELSVVREALEEADEEQVRDALHIVNSIFEKNVDIVITEDQMYKNPEDEELEITADELASLLDDEEDHRIC